MLNATPSQGEAILGTYVRPELVLARGSGTKVWDEEGREYLDFTAGIGVNALGHGSALVADAIRSALETGLVHTSNLYRTRPGEELARRIVDASFPGRVFFCNSGAEATEAAFKFARKWAGQGREAPAEGEQRRHEILAFRGSFHGRLFGSLAATDRPGCQAPFEPLMPGVRFAEVGDITGVRDLLARGTVAAVLIEPVQGEGGIVPVPADFLHELRTACDEAGSLLIFDEVQCGLGRTGRLFAYEHAGVVPDILTLAKPLGGGLPMGAVVVSESVASSVDPGDHATTFGGGPLVASAALAVFGAIASPVFLAEVQERSRYLQEALQGLRESHANVLEIRGSGLMLGIVLAGDAAPAVSQARDAGLLVVSAGPQVVRLLPPLNVGFDEIDAAVGILSEALG